MNISIFSKIDDKGNTYWTATFDKVPEVIGGGNTPQEALNEGLENLKYFKNYLMETGDKRCETITLDNDTQKENNTDDNNVCKMSQKDPPQKGLAYGKK